MFEDAIKAATKLLNDKSLKIVEYAETDDYYLFNYVNNDNSIEFDNSMIKYDKNTKKASFYMISINLDEINNLKFKRIKNKNCVQKICPKCGGKLIEILYGFPTPESVEKYKKGEIELGGCEILLDKPQPKYHCRKCDKSYYEDENL